METQAQDGGKTHTCDLCGEVFATQEDLDRHLREQHADGAEDLSVPDGTGGSKTDGSGGMVQSE
jgi:Zinc finger, C2H2 type